MHARVSTYSGSPEQVNPGVEVDEIGTCMTALDPFGNTLRFNEPRVDRPQG